MSQEKYISVFPKMCPTEHTFQRWFFFSKISFQSQEVWERQCILRCPLPVTTKIVQINIPSRKWYWNGWRGSRWQWESMHKHTEDPNLNFSDGLYYMCNFCVSQINWPAELFCCCCYCSVLHADWLSQTERDSSLGRRVCSGTLKHDVLN